MEDVASQNNTSSKFPQIIIIVLIVLILIISIGIIYLLFSQSKSQNNAVNPVNKPVNFSSQTQQEENNDLVDVSKAEVKKAYSNYSVLGTLQELQNEGDTYTISLSTPTGEQLLSKLEFKLNPSIDVQQVSGENFTPISISELSEGDSIEINFSLDHKTKAIDVPLIYKYTP